MKKILLILRKWYHIFLSKIFKFILDKQLYFQEELPEYDSKYLESLWEKKDPGIMNNSPSEETDPRIDLSIIIPLYNSEDYLESLLNMLIHQDTKYYFEVIFVNDGSSDNTCEKTAEMIKPFHNMRLVNKNNGGISSARNLGIEMAQGCFISFIDHDDIISDQYVQLMLEKANLDNSKIVKCGFGYVYGDTIIDAGIANGYIWGGVYQKSLFSKIRFPNGYWYEDMINNFLIKPQTHDISVTNEVLYYKRSTKRNASKTVWNARNNKCLEHIYLIEYCIEAYINLGLDDKTYLLERVLVECSSLAYERTKMLDKLTQKQVFLKCCQIVNELIQNGANQIAYSRYNNLIKIFQNKDYTGWKLLRFL